MMHLHHLSQKRSFWLLFTAISFVCAGFSIKYFSRAFPVVTIDLRMNRSGALEKSSVLVKKHQWGPTQTQQTASFQTDNLVKTFIELEAGGKKAFIAMMEKKLYIPYNWYARHFKEFEPHEVTVRFTPEGAPYGFSETLSENALGPDLTADAAQKIAEQHATQDWQIDLSKYKLIEASKEMRPSGRGDHTFVYQRHDITIGDGFYRLRLRVSGDKCTELTHFVHVPEAFLLRYQQMRSANISIASAASMAVTILYTILGCIIGLFFLLRHGWTLWRLPLFWGVIVAFLQFLVALNQLPLAWMVYDTALPMHTFLLQYIVNNLYALVYSTFSYTIAFMAAESLTRKAFGSHPQLWRVWSKNIANSFGIFGRTVGGYLLVPIMFAYIVVLYAFTQQYLGWWTPSSQLLDPNILSNYFPWFSSIAISLKAGFWEECLFRAVPLSAAALLGKRFGKKNWWIVFAFILQAIIFGAAHANYPAQPAYARLIELIFPSFIFGGVYLAFGLLPSIIMHVIYDVVWFALPVFISTAPSARTNQLLIILLSLIPLFIVAYRWLRNKKWQSLTNASYNSSWQPVVETQVAHTHIEQKHITLSRKMLCTLLISGGIGLAGYAAFTEFKQQAPTLTITKKSAKHLSSTTIQNQYQTKLDTPWSALNSAQSHFKYNASKTQHRFIWQKGKEKVYNNYLNTHLMPPHWMTRFVKFTGPIVERAEEHQTFIGRDGNIIRTRHQLPETQSGAQLEEEPARVIAHAGLKKHFDLDHTQLKEISAVAAKRPARKDWVFEFADEKNYPLEKGQARIAVSVAGETVNDAYRYIHVPEEWEREERKKNNLAQVISTLCNLLIYVLFLLGLSISLVRWSTGNFSAYYFLLGFLGIFSLFVGSLFNSWPQIVATFNTSEPFASQVFRTFGFGTIYALIRSAVVALVVALTLGIKHRSLFRNKKSSLIVGLSLGALIVGLQALLTYFAPSIEPLWADYTALGNCFPVIAPTITALTKLTFASSLFLLLCTAIDQWTAGFTKKRFISAFLLIIFTLVVTGLQAPVDLTFWLISGATLGTIIALLYACIIRFDHTIIPLIVGFITISELVQQAMFNAYPMALVANAFASVCVLGVSVLWWKQLNK